MVAQEFFYGSFSGIAISLCLGVCAIQCAYLILHRPSIKIFDEGICITNPLRKITVGWDKVQDITAHYTMSIQVDGRVINAWAAPAPGRYHSRRIHPSEIKGLGIDSGGSIRPGESPRSHSGVAFYFANTRYKSFNDAGTINGCPTENSFNTSGLAIVIASAVIGTLLIVQHLY
jgi:hypothetical protein